MPPKGSKRKKPFTAGNTPPSSSSQDDVINQDDPYTFDSTQIAIVQPTSPLPLILTSEKRHGFYECDYCRTDLSQVPRICCSICSEFDLCLECFATQGSYKKKAKNGANSNVLENKVRQHTPVLLEHNPLTHGYRVCDSTRYFMFPSLRGVEQKDNVLGFDEDEEDATKYKRTLDMQDGGEAEIHPMNQVDVVEQKVQEISSQQGPMEIEEEGTVSQDVTTEKDTNHMGNGHLDDHGNGIQTHRTTVADKTWNGDLPEESVNDQESFPKETKQGSLVTTSYDSNSNIIYEWTDNPQCIWTVEEDLRLLDAIGTLGLGNWVDISEEVAGTSGVSNKNPKRCMERYLYDYLGKYGCILPQYTLIRVEDENADENEGKDKNAVDKISGVSNSGRKRAKLNGTPSFSRQSSSVSMSSTKGTPINKQYRPVLTSSLPGYDKVWPNPFIPEGGSIQLGDDVGRDLSIRAEQAYVKASTSASTQKEADDIRKEWEETRLNKYGGPTVLPPRPEDVKRMQGSDLAGYMPRRGDFDIEWDNDAEKLIQDMEFSPSDSVEERELKIKVLKIYDARLNEREKRKQFLIDRNLLDFRKKLEEENKLPADERDLVNRLRLFARFHSAEEHDEFIQNILKAKRIRKEISRLQMYRRMGFTSLADAERFELDRTRREKHRLACEEIMIKEKKVVDATKEQATSKLSLEPSLKKYKMEDRNGSATVLQDSPNVDMELNTTVTESSLPVSGDNGRQNVVDAPASTDSASSCQGFDVKTLPLVELLSTKEIDLCQTIEMAPKLYLEVKDALLRESLAAGLLDREDCAQRTVHKIDVQKRGEVYNFILQRGWIPSLP